MFSNLIETQPQKSGTNKGWFFLGTLILYIFIFSGVSVASIMLPSVNVEPMKMGEDVEITWVKPEDAPKPKEQRKQNVRVQQNSRPSSGTPSSGEVAHVREAAVIAPVLKS